MLSRKVIDQLIRNFIIICAPFAFNLLADFHAEMSQSFVIAAAPKLCCGTFPCALPVWQILSLTLARARSVSNWAIVFLSNHVH